MLKVSQIEIIRDGWRDGKSISEIAKALGLDRKTVRKYIEKEDFSPSIKIQKPGRSRLEPYKVEIDAMLESECAWYRKQRHTAKRILSILAGEHPEAGISYQMVQRYVREKRAERKRKSYSDPGTMPLVWHKGEAQADFGEADFIEGDEVRRHKFLNLSFPYSNRVFTVVLPGENCECVCHGLKQIFSYIGAIPRIVVFDNATGVGRRAFGHMKEHELFTRFRMHYGFMARFANVEAGWEKGSVENSIGFVRRNLMVPPMKVQGTLERFSAEVVLPLSSKLRLDDPHYRKGLSSAELFADDESSMRPYSDVPDFDVVRFDACRLSATGTATFESRHTYCLGPNHSFEQVIVAKGAWSIAFYSQSGLLMKRFDRLYGEERSEVYDMESILKGLCHKPNSWMNSVIRDAMEDGGFRDMVDRASGNDRRRLIYMLNSGSSEYGFPIASYALNRLSEGGRCPTKDDMMAYCGRLVSLDPDAAENPTNVDLGVFDRLLSGREGA